MRKISISKDTIRRGILSLILAIVIIQLGRSSVGKFYVVDGESMWPTLISDDVVQAKASFVKARGDVVVLSDDSCEEAIKRIVGLPGETVTIYRGHVYINGEQLHEPYLAEGIYTFRDDPKNERPQVWRLDSTEYFLLGDNRYESRDSRHYGPVEQKCLNGIVDLPANSPEPALLEVTLSKSGNVIHHKHYGPTIRARARTLQVADTRS